MEGGALFNPGFLGGNFLWWVGQVVDDKEWRDNVKQEKHKSKKDIPGWGYRYKVRIIGLHDQEEQTLKSENLPWAQVMYPITAGGGQGSAYQTPAIRPGNFVFGFFLDGQDQQVPVIMGVLGANAQIDQDSDSGASGGKNFASKSGFGGKDPDPVLQKIPDANLATEQPNSGASPAINSPTDPNLENAADGKKETVLKRKHPLVCADPQEISPLKGIQTVLQNLTQKIQEYQSALQTYAGAVTSVAGDAAAIAAAIKDASCEIAKFLMTILQLLRDFITDLFSKIMEPIFKIAPPTTTIELLDKLIKALEIISCIFNKIGLNLCNAAENSINDALARRGGNPLPPNPPPGYYCPDPICSAEEIVSDLIGNNINDIIRGVNAGMQPIFDDVNNTLNDFGLGTGSSPSSSPAGGLSGVPSFNVPNIPGMDAIGGLGDLGGLGGGFDMGSALNFISAIMAMFSCDPKPKCSPNDTHTLEEGGSGKPSTDEPSPGAVASASITKQQANYEASLAAATGGGTLTGAGTAAEANENYALPPGVA